MTMLDVVIHDDAKGPELEAYPWDDLVWGNGPFSIKVLAREVVKQPIACQPLHRTRLHVYKYALNDSSMQRLSSPKVRFIHTGVLY